MKKRNTSTECSICNAIDEYTEIENAQDSDIDDSSWDFPEAIKSLVSPNTHLQSYFKNKNDALLKCPECKTYYSYHQWTPGGSDDVFKTYIHESVKRINYFTAYKELMTALYNAWEYNQKGKTDYSLNEYKDVQNGVEMEMSFLKRKCLEIINDAVLNILSKHAYSKELAVTYQQLFPHAVSEKHVCEARVREQKVAEYDSKVIAEFYQYCGSKQTKCRILKYLVKALADDNENVRIRIKDLVMKALDEGERFKNQYASVIVTQFKKRSELNKEEEIIIERCSVILR